MEHMELGENVVALNFQNLFHSDKSLRTFKISTFFHHGKHKKKIAHIDLCQFEFVEIENTKSINDVNYGIYLENSIDHRDY